ncbi:MAG: hypothetical protein LBN71_06465 [Tannerella sp.]|jgi:hypothetical protein|nr:hypothetical protein [Tannerella sp.]
MEINLIILGIIVGIVIVAVILFFVFKAIQSKKTAWIHEDDFGLGFEKDNFVTKEDEAKEDEAKAPYDPFKNMSPERRRKFYDELMILLRELPEDDKSEDDLEAGMGTEEDEMPEGFGEFGLEITNPVPVYTIVGNSIYLERLRTMDGIKVTYKRTSTMHAPNIPSIIDEYRIFVHDKEITKLYICPFNKKNSNKAPKGFVLAEDEITPE